MKKLAKNVYYCLDHGFCTSNKDDDCPRCKPTPPEPTQSPDPKAWERDFDEMLEREYPSILWGVINYLPIKSFIHSQISQVLQAERKIWREAEGEQARVYADDWVQAMWDMDVFDHKDWTGVDEVQASLGSYLNGLHIKNFYDQQKK